MTTHQISRNSHGSRTNQILPYERPQRPAHPSPPQPNNRPRRVQPVVPFSVVFVNTVRAVSGGVWLALVVFIITLFAYLLWPSPPPLACKLGSAENRAFHAYYGLTCDGFALICAEPKEPDAININKSPAMACPMSCYGNHVPQSIQTLFNSFVFYADRGCGKTAYRFCYLRPTPNQLVIDLFNPTMLQAFENFQRNTQSNICHGNWNEADMEILILSRLVRNFVEKFNENPAPLRGLAIETRLTIVTTLLLYLDDPHVPIASLVEELIGKPPQGFVGWWNGETWKRIVPANWGLPPNIPARFRPLSPINSYHRAANLVMLTDIYNRFKIHDTNPAFPTVNTRDELMRFFSIIKKTYHLQPVITLDGVDENEFLFRGNDVYVDALEKVIKSSMSNFVLDSLVKPDLVRLQYFFVRSPNLALEKLPRRTFLTTVPLNWDKDGLRNYADFILQEMAKTSKNGCKLLPDFATLVDWKNSSHIFDNIQSPRHLNVFMGNFFAELGKVCTKTDRPFLATKELVEFAFTKTQEGWITSKVLDCDGNEISSHTKLSHTQPPVLTRS